MLLPIILTDRFFGVEIHDNIHLVLTCQCKGLQREMAERRHLARYSSSVGDGSKHIKRKARKDQNTLYTVQIQSNCEVNDTIRDERRTYVNCK